MAKTGYEVNYDDERFTQVKNEEKADIKESDKMYDGMINSSDKYYDAQINAAEDWGKEQAKIQQDQTDYTLETIEQQKEFARKDYEKEQSGAWVDYQRQSNDYGTNAEKQAEMGLASSGYSESSQVAMYNQYQNRVAVARESFNRAMVDYDNMMKEARLQNSAALAQIAYQTLQTTLEISLQGFQYKNSLILEKANAKANIKDRSYNKYRDVLSQINTENSFAEQVRQFDETMAYNRSRSSGGYSGGDAIITGNLGDDDAPIELTRKDMNDIENAITVLDRIPVDVVVGSGENEMKVNEYVVDVIENMGLSEAATKWLLNNYRR